MSKILEQNVVMLFFRSRCCCCHLICFHFLFTKTKIVICLQTAKHLLCQAAIQSLKQSVSLSVAIFCLNKNLYIVFVRKFHFISQLLIVSTKCSYVTLKTQTQTDGDTYIYIYIYIQTYIRMYVRLHRINERKKHLRKTHQPHYNNNNNNTTTTTIKAKKINFLFLHFPVDFHTDFCMRVYVGK